MSKIKCPTPGSGTGTFSDALVGQQITGTEASAMMTQENFLFNSETPEKDDRSFITDDFSKPISLDDLDPIKVQEVKQKINNTLVKFNKDKSDGTIVSLYGSLKERLRVGIERVIKTFPAALVVSKDISSNTVGVTATNISYNTSLNKTEFTIPQRAIKNDFSIEYTTKGTFITLEDGYSELRNFTKTYTRYVVLLEGVEYSINYSKPPKDNDDLLISVNGKPFTGSTSTLNFLIKPSEQVVEEYFYNLSDTEAILLSRESNPLYVASFKVPREDNEGNTFYRFETARLPVVDNYNIDIKSSAYNNYVITLNDIGDIIDNYKTNLITRFLVTASLSEFDTADFKMDSVFKLYGHKFDEIKLFIDNIAYMRNVSYDKVNNIPDLLLKNLCETLGLESVANYTEDELNRLLYRSKDSTLLGEGKNKSIAEADVEMYRRLLVNVAHLFKSKGTRKAIEFLMKFIGAPESLYEYNEHVYEVTSPLDLTHLQKDIDAAVAGTLSGVTFSYNGVYSYLRNEIGAISRESLPLDEDGYPKMSDKSDEYFFQKGAGWFERTTEHKSYEVLDLERSILTGNTKVIKTRLREFVYGQDYLDRYRQFPSINIGFDLTKKIDNKKIYNVEDNENAKLILNVKNIDLHLSGPKAIAYDVWRQSDVHNKKFGNMPVTSGMTFAEFADQVVKNGIKDIHKIKYIKKYLDLYEIYTEYLNYSGLTKAFTYKNTGEYIKTISPLWIRLVEQFIPATTIWSGGNRIDNTIFHRQKFKYQEPCKVKTFTDLLYPSSFQSTLESDLEDTIKNHPRGLCILTGVTFQPLLELDSDEYTGSGSTVTGFSGYTFPSECGMYSIYTEGLPLVCNYQNYLQFSENDFREEWVSQIDGLVSNINTLETYWACGLTGTTYINHKIDFTQVQFGTTGVTISGVTTCIDTTKLKDKKKLDYEVFVENGVSKVRFKTYKYGYNICSANDVTLGYLVDKQMVCNECQMYAELLPTVSGSSVNCGTPQDLTLRIYNGTPISGTSINSYKLYFDCEINNVNFTYSGNGNCDEFTLFAIDPSIPFELLIADAANCQTKLKFLGFEELCIDENVYVCHPVQELVTAHNIGFIETSYVTQVLDTSLSGSTLTEAEFLTLQDGVDYTSVQPGTLTSGDLVLGVVANAANSTHCNYANLNASGASFSYQYQVMTIKEIDCLYSDKSIALNSSGYTYIPNQEVYVYNGVDFVWKKASDVTTSDSLVDRTGTLIPVTSSTFDNCTQNLYYHISVEEDLTTRVALFNGTSSSQVIVSNPV